MVGDRSAETVDDPSSQPQHHHQLPQEPSAEFSQDVVVAQLRNVRAGRGPDIHADLAVIREKNGIEGEGGEAEDPDLTNDLGQNPLALQHTCILTTSPAVVTVANRNSDGNHLSVHRVLRAEEEIEEEIEECCVGEEGQGGEEEGMLTAVVAKHHGHHQVTTHGITVTGVRLADLHHHGEQHELMTVDDSLQHHHVQHNVSLTHHHSHDENGTIITIPVVGSLTPYTVIADNESCQSDDTALGVTITGEQEIITHHQQQQQQQEQEVSHQQLVQTHQQTHQQGTEIHCNSHLTWEEAVSAPVLPVRCKDTNAELHKTKFGSGNKGKCIKHGPSDWFTPTEFEALCGRGNSKDWKRSIRFGGRTLQTLIDKGFLVPHASSCICSNCVDDATATGPIRPFTPYQRKRKGQSTDHTKGTKLERLTSKDSNTDESSDIGTPGTPLGMMTGLNPLTQALMKINQVSLPACTQEAWKVVEEAVDSIVNAGTALKSLVQEMKDRTNQETESLRSQLQNSLQTTLVQNPIVGQPQILRIFDSNRIQTYSIEVLDPESFKPLQTNSTGISKCENCGRDGSLECSGCHVVHYCSSFCQKKDWPAHQGLCADRGQPECKTEPQLP